MYLADHSDTNLKFTRVTSAGFLSSVSVIAATKVMRLNYKYFTVTNST